MPEITVTEIRPKMPEIRCTSPKRVIGPLLVALTSSGVNIKEGELQVE